MSRRSRSRTRSRSRSPKRERDDRRRREDRERKRDRKEKKRRRRSSSSNESIDSHKLGSILKEERRKREKSRERSSPKYAPESSSDVNIPFDINSLNESAKKWLEDRIVEQVTSRVDKLESLMTEKATSARKEMEKMLRAQIEAEMANELEECKKRDEESRKKCLQLESELQRKIAEAEESKKKFEENRLAMLEHKSQLERERAELARQKADLKKSEQQAILNKGGGSRAPIKMKFGK